MRKAFIAALLLGATVAQAAEESKKTKVSDAVEKTLVSVLGRCNAPATYLSEPYTNPLPKGFSGTIITVESESLYCAGRHLHVTAPNGDYWIGTPWVLSAFKGTPEERLRQFGLERLKLALRPSVNREKVTHGLYSVEIADVSDNGRMVMQGLTDPAGDIFFIGNFLSKAKSAGEQRMARIAPIVAKAPSRGDAKASVTLVEFSDFQCPSCRKAAEFLPGILAKYGDRVRYTRVDLPLMTAHPWAYGAAVMGRAIHRQNPAKFWEFKDAIYENQDKLNLFTLEDFARSFIADHQLDAKRFEADINSAALKQEILDSVGAAFSIPVWGTPTYLVNGEVVIAGPDGKSLDDYIAQLTK